eukprot:m.279791 g.279791  ORF g.279791 m.279791 type:complete len:354 (+) comp143924_c0_seq1:108-1169(+)
MNRQMLVVLQLCVVAVVVRSRGFSPKVIFKQGDIDDTNRTWACVRGPAIVRSSSGSLLAFGGGTTTCNDGGIGFGILLRTSSDNGATWSSIKRVAGDDNTTGGYIAPIVDVKHGKVLLLYNRKFSEVWLTTSTDNGVHWDTNAINITGTTGPMAIGPPGGIQLPSSGRVVLAAHSNGTFALISDDGGTSWHQGSRVVFPTGVSNGGESQIIADGRGPDSLSMLIRISSHDVLLNHAVATSDDGGETWSVAQVVVGVTGQNCEGSISRAGDTQHLLISAPHYPRWRYPEDRKNMTVFTIGKNVSQFQVLSETQIFGGPAAYSSLTPAGDFVLFEGGNSYRYASIMVASTNLTFA